MILFTQLALNLYQFCWEYTRGLAILVGRLVTHGTKERLSIFPAKIFKTLIFVVNVNAEK